MPARPCLSKLAPALAALSLLAAAGVAAQGPRLGHLTGVIGEPGGDAVAATCTPLAAAEVAALLQRTAEALDAPEMTVAVVDRGGRPLGLYRRPGTPLSLDDRAVGLARTAAFFSNDQAPLSSRTIRFISGIHFPPGIPNTPNAALYGIENTNRGCDLNVPFLPGQGIVPAKSVSVGCNVAANPDCPPCNPFDDRGCGSGPVTGKADALDSDPGAVDPGGLPIYSRTSLIGGLGVAGPPLGDVEFAALEGLLGAGLSPVSSALAPPRVVFIDGIRLPFVDQTLPPTRPAGTGPGSFSAADVVLGPRSGGCAPEGDLVATVAGTRLSAADVGRIVEQAKEAASRTRAVIRLPIGQRARMAIAVADVDGRILALHRMPDATVFSIDVAVAKARNVVYFSDPTSGGHLDLPGVPSGTAVTNRTISFGAQPLFPPGIDRLDEPAESGPFFALFQSDLANPCSQGSQPAHLDQNGVVFFPGSIPLYQGGTLVGGLGISGDGVEQDDYVSYLGAEGFRPPENLWADRVKIDGARLPFLKFPRNPEK